MKDPSRFDQEKAKQIVEIIDRFNAARKIQEDTQERIDKLLDDVAQRSDQQTLRIIYQLRSEIKTLRHGHLSGRDFDTLVSFAGLDRDELIFRDYQHRMATHPEDPIKDAYDRGLVRSKPGVHEDMVNEVATYFGTTADAIDAAIGRRRANIKSEEEERISHQRKE